MAEAVKYDENLYSRMMGAYGVETVGKLVQLKIFLSGLRGVGIETAKNLILCGPAVVQIHDDGLVEAANLGCNFFAKETDIGVNTRAQASLPQLKELNPYCSVEVHTGAITAEVLANFDVVVITDNYYEKEAVEINDICRANNKGFIFAGQLGLYGFTFVDFGESHKVFDVNGVEPRNAIVVGVSQNQEALVSVMEEKRHGFSSGDFVVFREIEGMTELNGNEYEIEEKGPYTFTLKGIDTTKFNAYTRQGIVEQVKKPKTFQFRKLSESITNPIAPGKNELDISDWGKSGRPEQLHLALTGLFQFIADKKQLPQLNSAEDADQLVEIVKRINDQRKNIEEGVLKVEEVNEEVVKNVARFARAQISPLASFWGGIIAQEIIKYTGKYQPLRQWLHYECFEALPDEPVQRTPSSTRYSDQIAIFGEEFQQKLQAQKTFLVGAGALGCEFIKLFALTGLGTETNGGEIVVTDDDQIEMSNLNRQFLFRKTNIGQFKSECACKAGSDMNQSIRFKSLKERVAPENERIFNDEFWESRDFIVNAVDNVKARLFVDGRCVWFSKPLFESGTLGTKCNSQVIIPHQTQSYGDSIDPPEESIPLCTIKNFPYQIEHTIQWARDYFEGVLVEGPKETEKFIKDPNGYLTTVNQELKEKPAMLKSRLQIILKYAKAYSNRTYQSCIEIAREMYEDIFFNQISQLLHSFPLDHKTESGQPFWSGIKRPPVPISFDTSDNTSIEFIQSTANILAKIFGLSQEEDAQAIAQAAFEIKLEPFIPKQAARQVDDQSKTEVKPQVENDEQAIDRLLEQLRKLEFPTDLVQINPTEFEKDDPTNWHIEFVSAVANLRARNYKINEVPKFKVKLIAGKIIPALATTTAMIVGSVGIEIFKYILQKPITTMKNAFINLALPLWIFSEPEPPIIIRDKEYDPVLMGPVKAIPVGHTTWDNIPVNGPMTIRKFNQFFQKKYQVSISIISLGNLCLYNTYMPDAQKKEQMDIAQIVQEEGENLIPDYKKFLELKVCAETQNGDDATLPIIKYAFQM